MALFIVICFLAMIPVYFLTSGRYMKFLYHDILGWHIPDDNIKSDGVITESTCKICGKKIIQDSQWNWF